MSKALSISTGALRDEYQTVIVGSGYGGAVTAARLAESGNSVCLLERGKEWQVGEFPDEFKELARNVRSKKNPLGLLDYYLCKDLDVLKGSGLGGGSLINLNVAFRPDRELFNDHRWPKAYRDLAESGKIWDYYQRVERMLRTNPHPRWDQLTKVKMMKKRADQLKDARFGPVEIAVNFDVDGLNHVGVPQKPCIDCGDCFPGCNVGAKGTLAMNYLPFAKQKGAAIFTQIDVRYVEKRADGGYTVAYRHNTADGHGKVRQLRAKNVVLSAGAVGSTEILLRSTDHGLKTSARLGGLFSGNGDFIGLAYNTDHRTDVLGFGNRPDSKRSKVAPGPTIASVLQYTRSGAFEKRITIEDFAVFPSALVDFFRRSLPALAGVLGDDTDGGFSDELGEGRRVARDLTRWSATGALNHSMLYLAMAIDDAKGKLSLDDDDKLDINWPSVKSDPIFETIEEEIRDGHTKTLGGTFVHLERLNPWPRKKNNLITAHPLGGCALADDSDYGVVDADGQVFDGEGGVHQGLFVVDGAVVPMAVAVNPFLTISAIAERISSTMPGNLRS